MGKKDKGVTPKDDVQADGAAETETGTEDVLGDTGEVVGDLDDASEDVGAFDGASEGDREEEPRDWIVTRRVHVRAADGSRKTYNRGDILHGEEGRWLWDEDAPVKPFYGFDS